jgi:hypothetical protein
MIASEPPFSGLLKMTRFPSGDRIGVVRVAGLSANRLKTLRCRSSTQIDVVLQRSLNDDAPTVR